jgi:hypothetical protein
MEPATAHNLRGISISLLTLTQLLNPYICYCYIVLVTLGCRALHYTGHGLQACLAFEVTLH